MTQYWKNKGILLYKHSTIQKNQEKTLRQFYHLIYRPYFNVANCPKNIFCNKRKPQIMYYISLSVILGPFNLEWLFLSLCLIFVTLTYLQKGADIL